MSAIGMRSPRVAPVLVCLLAAGLLLQGCCATFQQPTAQAPPTEEPAPGYQVRRNNDSAWATLMQLENLDPLTGGDWRGLVKHGFVHTDSKGQAEICPDGSVIPSTGECQPSACHVYVYENSMIGFDYYCCPRDEAGTDLCSCSGTQRFDECTFEVRTLSADLKGSGTSFTVAYDWQTQTTVVTVEEGSVTITPVTSLKLEGSPAKPPTGDVRGMRQWLDDLEVQERTLGEPVRLEAVPEGTPRQFLYTAPDAKLAALQAESQGLPVARRPQPLEKLPALVLPLHKLEPQLEPWLERMGSAKPGELHPGLSPQVLVPGEGLNVRILAAGQADTKVLDALTEAVDWQSLNKTAFNADLPAVVKRSAVAGEERDIIKEVPAVGYSPETARSLFRAAGSKTSVVIVVSDTRLQEAAQYVQGQLAELGVKSRVATVSAGSESSAIQSAVDQGSAVIELAVGQR
jgi:hypothetical protein